MRHPSADPDEVTVLGAKSGRRHGIPHRIEGTTIMVEWRGEHWAGSRWALTRLVSRPARRAQSSSGSDGRVVVTGAIAFVEGSGGHALWVFDFKSKKWTMVCPPQQFVGFICSDELPLAAACGILSSDGCGSEETGEGLGRYGERMLGVFLLFDPSSVIFGKTLCHVSEKRAPTVISVLNGARSTD